MNYSIDFTAALIFVFASSLLWIVAKLLRLKVPVVYGRHEAGQYRCRIPTRLSWILMEAPASLVFTYFLFTGPLPVTPPVLALFVMWQMHYFHRAFVYPFQIQIRPGATTPLRMTLFGAIMCTACGYLNGAYISTYGFHLQSNDWFYTPAFIVGTTLFLLGYALNKVSDRELINLRKRAPNDYSVPYGGAYRWVSCPNYLGEIITWYGFCCAAWSIAGFTFAFMTTSNLILRALENHQWYQEKFPDYPPERKAIFPYAL